MDEVTEPAKSKDTSGRESLLSKIEDHWLEITAASLLALATLMSALCAFVAAGWHADSTDHYNKSTNAMVAASEQLGNAHQQVLIDVVVFSNYFNAVSRGETQLAAAYETAAFSPQLKAAFKAWTAAEPFKNPGAPANPFAMPEYKNPYREKAIVAQKVAKEQAVKGKNAIGHSDTYILLTVLFASVLFFAGISTKFKDNRIKLALLALGLCMFIASTVVFALQP
jgi:hypothetical protein